MTHVKITNKLFLTTCSDQLEIRSNVPRLKARWAVLTKKIDLKLEKVPMVVYACFVLHNYCEQYSSYINEDIIASQIQDGKANEETTNLPDPVHSCNNSEGEVVRNILTHYVRINLPDDLVI